MVGFDDQRRYAGRHLVVDLVGTDHIDDPGYVDSVLRRCARTARVTVLSSHIHEFQPNSGVSGVVILAESHVSIHSWPEYRYAAIDLFMCGRTYPHKAISVLKDTFKPEQIIVSEHLRGEKIWARHRASNGREEEVE